MERASERARWLQPRAWAKASTKLTDTKRGCGQTNTTPNVLKTLTVSVEQCPKLHVKKGMHVCVYVRGGKNISQCYANHSSTAAQPRKAAFNCQEVKPNLKTQSTFKNTGR